MKNKRMSKDPIFPGLYSKRLTEILSTTTDTNTNTNTTKTPSLQIETHPRAHNISAIPNEILYTIASNLSLQDRISLRDSNPRDFGAPLNQSIREDFSHQDDYIVTAMFHAAGKGDIKMIRHICEKGLGYAIRVDRYLPCDQTVPREQRPGYFLLGQKPTNEIIDNILRIGPNLMIGESSGYSLIDIQQGMITTHSALSWSLKKNSLTKLQQFIEMGADPRLVIEMEPVLGKENPQEKTILSILDSPHPGSMDPGEARRVMCQGIADSHFYYSLVEDMDAAFVSNGGNTLIHMAVLCSNPIRMVKAVLAKGVDINSRNDYGETALSLAFSYKCSPPKLVRVLLENGAETSVTPYYLTDTMVFSKTHHEKIAVFINYMEYDYRGGDGLGSGGDTLLHTALRCEMPIRYVKSLLKRDLDVNAQNSEGKTALNLAASAASHQDVLEELKIVKLLKINGADETIKDNYGLTGFERDFEWAPVEEEIDRNLPLFEESSDCTDGW